MSWIRHDVAVETPTFGSGGTPVSADTGIASESLSAQATNSSAQTEAGAVFYLGAAVPSELGASESMNTATRAEPSLSMVSGIVSSSEQQASFAQGQTVPAETASAQRTNAGVPVEWTGTAAVTVAEDQLVNIEFSASANGVAQIPYDGRSDLPSGIAVLIDEGLSVSATQSANQEISSQAERCTFAATEILSGTVTNVAIPAEWAGTAVMTVNGDAASPIEFGTSVQEAVILSASLIGTVASGALVPQETLYALAGSIMSVTETGIKIAGGYTNTVSIDATIGAQVRVTVEWQGFGKRLIGTVSLDASKVTVSIDGLRPSPNLDGEIVL